MLPALASKLGNSLELRALSKEHSNARLELSPSARMVGSQVGGGAGGGGGDTFQSDFICLRKSDK